VIEWLKANVTVVEKEIYSKEFNDLMSEHSHSHQEEAQEEAAAEDETEE
jgi:trigger factor